MQAQISIPHDQIAEFCQRNHIRRLALFGSVLRDDFRPDSDVDVLVEFEAGARVGMFELVDMQDQLGELLGRDADLCTPDGLNRHIRGKALATARIIYEQGLDAEFAQWMVDSGQKPATTHVGSAIGIANERDEVHLRIMLDACREAQQFIAGKDCQSLADDAMLQYALVWTIGSISRAASQVMPETRAELAQIDWMAVAGIRDRVLHDFNKVNVDATWDVVTTDIPTLLAELEKILPPESEANA